MKFRVALLVPALLALVVSMLAATPAQAASFSSGLKSKSIAITTSGKGQVAIACRTKSTCRGTLQFAGAKKTTKYSVKGRTTAYAKVAINASASANPHRGGADVNGQFKRKSATLKIKQTSPSRKSKSYRVRTETRLARQQITGTIRGNADVGDIRVELVTTDRGGNTHVVQHVAGLRNGQKYRFNVPLGANNSDSPGYRIRVSAEAAGNDARSWFWRGRSGRAVTGGRYLRDATVVRATKARDFVADVRYTSISGTAPNGARLTIAAAPPSYNGGAVVRRELDIPGCANVYATDTVTNGTYRVDFLPFTPGEKRYLVAALTGSNERWNNAYGSCFDVQDYKYSRANMLALTSAGRVHNVVVGPSRSHLRVDAGFRGFKPTAQGDRWVSIREAVPGVPVLDSPVVEAKMASAGGAAQFNHLAPGRYYVEIGRRTGCADWYASRFTNNRSYFKGLDRGAERWKSFTTLSKLPGNKKRGYEYLARTASPNPATDAKQGKKPRGYAGWMYRNHCKALGTGTYKVVNISGVNRGTRKVSLVSKRGGVVRGHINRVDGRTNKEMMVTLSSTDGRRVLRTDITDGKGNFYIAGLPSGRWRITVNADSWRGIGRAYKGRKTVTVKAGRRHNVGTLRFLD